MERTSPATRISNLTADSCLATRRCHRIAPGDISYAHGVRLKEADRLTSNKTGTYGIVGLVKWSRRSIISIRLSADGIAVCRCLTPVAPHWTPGFVRCRMIALPPTCSSKTKNE